MRSKARCEHDGCGAPAVDRFRGEWLCAAHLNPDLGPPEVVLVRSWGQVYDELEPGAYVSIRSSKRRGAE